MINFKQGWLSNLKTGEKKDIVVKAKSPNKLVDILIGGGLVLAGIAHLTVSAFKKGSKAYEEAEFKTMCELDLIEPHGDSVKIGPAKEGHDL